MRDALDQVGRDIVYSLCQYGMGDVWTWGAEVGGNCWRTTGDIDDRWANVRKIFESQAGHEKDAEDQGEAESEVAHGILHGSDARR